MLTPLEYIKDNLPMSRGKKLTALIVFFVLLSIFGNIFQLCEGPKIISIKEKIDTTKIKQELHAEIETKLRAELKPIIKIKKVAEKINLDSLRKVIDQYWIDKIQATYPGTPDIPNILGKYIFTANADTILRKGKDTTMMVGVIYQSRIPLDTEGKISINALWYDRQITHTTETIITEQKTFWQTLFGNFNYSIQCGFGQGVINKQFDFYYGIGISYDIGKIF
jgi:hypothetical protein